MQLSSFPCGSGRTQETKAEPSAMKDSVHRGMLDSVERLRPPGWLRNVRVSATCPPQPTTSRGGASINSTHLSAPVAMIT